MSAIQRVKRKLIGCISVKIKLGGFKVLLLELKKSVLISGKAAMNTGLLY